jgi:serine/threonine-protein phosphatase 5
MCECLWSDPCNENGRHVSKRGVGLAFGPDVAEKFLRTNGLKYLIRSHEVKDEGYEYQKGQRVITIFSAPNYCDTMGNKGSYITMKGSTMEPTFHKYTAVVSPTP